MCPKERYIGVEQTRPGQARLDIVLVNRMQKSGTGDRTTILSNEKEHFSPTDQNERIGQSEPPSKVVSNIPVGPNQNGSFHLISNQV